MNHPIAIIVAGALIAAAIALTNRWTLHSQVLVRMDNWTGNTEWVNPRRRSGPLITTKWVTAKHVLDIPPCHGPAQESAPSSPSPAPNAVVSSTAA